MAVDVLSRTSVRSHSEQLMAGSSICDGATHGPTGPAGGSREVAMVISRKV